MLLHVKENALRFRRRVYCLCLGLCLLFVLLGSSSEADAHASLIESSPTANAELEQAPSQVTLTFNERLEGGLNELSVYDTSKRKVTEKSAEFHASNNALTLDLPKLGKGTYLVTYHVISEDGHPVDGTYLFAVGESLSQPGNNSSMEHMHHQEGPFDRFGIKDVLQFAARILFYLSMLAFTGWLFWMRRFGDRTSEELRDRLKRWGERWQQAYLISYILFMWAHIGDIIGESGSEGLLRLFTQTTIGYAWFGGLLLALLSFVVLNRSVRVDFIWLAGVWLCKSLLGHASALGPKGAALILDWLHFAASSVWIGGLLMLLMVWHRDKEEAKRLYSSYSNAALLCILLLIVSGALNVYLFLPDIRYVFETAWGKWLLAKSGLVVLVIAAAFFIRLAYRRNMESSVKQWMRMDAQLMALIIFIVGVFTYLNPLPTNAPLNWHVMGERVHMTAQISPNTPGINDFTVKVWLPEGTGKPKQVVFKLEDVKNTGIAPITVPLVNFEDRSPEESYGMNKYSYKARGAYLPYPGEWKLEVRILDSNDEETVYEKTVRVY